MINDPDEDAIILILEYMAGGQVMKYDRGMRKFVYGPTGGVMDERTVQESSSVEQVLCRAHCVVMHQAAKLLLDLIDGVMYLHSRGIAHRDIKVIKHANGREYEIVIVPMIPKYNHSRTTCLCMKTGHCASQTLAAPCNLKETMKLAEL